jgi:hypothetical protein
MTISEIKAEISLKAGIPSIGTLSLSRQFAEDSTPENPKPTEWLSYWNNEHRVRVIMHEDVAKQIATTPNFAALAVKPMEIVQPEDASKPPYKRFIVITPTNVEFTF